MQEHIMIMEKFNFVKINIIIPTYNCLNRLEATMESIRKQSFPKELIYVTIVDSGSVDGTYERSLQYDRYHLGIYRLAADMGERIRFSEASRLWWKAEGQVSYNFWITPGDVLYPDCLKHCCKVMLENGNNYVARLIGETDVRRKNGSVDCQKKLWNHEKLINGNEESHCYIDRGFQHQIITFGGDIWESRNRAGGEVNEGIWWNKSFRGGLNSITVYTPEVLGCVMEREYQDEMEEILLRWESIICMMRQQESKYGKVSEEGLNKKAYQNLSNYALWRSFLLWEKNMEKDAEDCFLISGVICPECKKEPIYMWLRVLLQDHNLTYVKLIRDFFDNYS